MAMVEDFLRDVTRICAKMGDKVIVLIDEYDAPLRCALKHEYFEDASEFMGRFFDHLRNNSNYTRACLTGLYRIDFGSSILSNMTIFDVMRPEYSQYFGFSIAEVERLLENHNYDWKIPMSKVQEWYNGYRFGFIDNVANPYSISRWLMEGGGNLSGTGTELVQFKMSLSALPKSTMLRPSHCSSVRSWKASPLSGRCPHQSASN
jgi:hypothetical protein